MDVPEELLEAKEAEQGEILALPGVTGIAIGLREEEGEELEELTVFVYVEDGEAVPDGIPETIGDAVVSIEETSVEPCVAEDHERYTEIKGGIRIQHPTAHEFGTLGTLVKEVREDEEEPNYYGLTAQHVVGNVTGEPFPYVVCQPFGPSLSIGSSPASQENAVGAVAAVQVPHPVPLVGGAIVGDVDAALVWLNLAEREGRGLSAAIVDQSGAGDLVGEVTGSEQPRLGSYVRKRGFVTRITEGKVKAIHGTVRWEPGGPNADLVEQFVIDTVSTNPEPEGRFCRKGDSGALVLEKGAPVAVGLLWGQDLGGFRAFASKIWKVEEALGVTVVL